MPWIPPRALQAIAAQSQRPSAHGFRVESLRLASTLRRRPSSSSQREKTASFHGARDVGPVPSPVHGPFIWRPIIAALATPVLKLEGYLRVDEAHRTRSAAGLPPGSSSMISITVLAKPQSFWRCVTEKRAVEAC